MKKLLVGLLALGSTFVFAQDTQTNCYIQEKMANSDYVKENFVYYNAKTGRSPMYNLTIGECKMHLSWDCRGRKEKERCTNKIVLKSNNFTILEDVVIKKRWSDFGDLIPRGIEALNETLMNCGCSKI